MRRGIMRQEGNNAGAKGNNAQNNGEGSNAQGGE